MQWVIVLKSLKFTCAVPKSTPPLPSLHRISTGVCFSMVQTLKVSDTDQAYLKVNWKALGSKKEKNQGVPTLISVHFQLVQVCSAQASHQSKALKSHYYSTEPAQHFVARSWCYINDGCLGQGERRLPRSHPTPSQTAMPLLCACTGAQAARQQASSGRRRHPKTNPLPSSSHFSFLDPLPKLAYHTGRVLAPGNEEQTGTI